MPRKTKELDEVNDEIEEKRDEIEEIRDEIRGIEDGDAHEEYDEMLDEQGDVKIGSLTYSPSQVLKAVDEIAYDVGYNEYTDEIISDKEERIDELEGEIDELCKEIKYEDLPGCKKSYKG